MLRLPSDEHRVSSIAGQNNVPGCWVLGVRRAVQDKTQNSPFARMISVPQRARSENEAIQVVD